MRQNEQLNDELKFKGTEEADSQKMVSIDIDKDANELDDDVLFVSPDESIFKQVAEKVNKVTVNTGYAATWHGRERENTGDFEIDEQYASTSQTNRQFMEAFGLTQSGVHKQASDKSLGINDDTSDEVENSEFEYNDRMQRKEIIGMYKYARRSLKIRLIFSIIFAAVIFFIENISIFVNTNDSWEFFDIVQHPYVHTVSSLVALILCGICAYEQLYHGTRSIIKKDLIPESIATIGLSVSILYSSLQLLLISVGYGHKPVLLNFPSAVIVCSTIMFSYVNILRERFGFGVVSSKDSKFILEKVQETNAEAEYDTFTTTSNGEFNGEIARVGKTMFVRNYFANTNAPTSIRKFLSVYYIVAFFVAFAFAIIAAFQVKDVVASITYFVASMLFMLPIGVLFSYSVPFYFANKALYEKEVTIVGEEAIAEFSNVDAVVVNDTTAFPPRNVKITNFNVYNDFDMEKVLYYASSGFSVVGGPLADVFDAATNNAVPKSGRVKFVCAGRSYLCVSVDGSNIIFADKFGMTAQGIEVGAERDDKDDVCVMYIACNGVLCSKMYIKYQMDEDFIKSAIQLNKNGLVVGIRTFDPNISNDLIKKITDFTKQNVRIIKLTSVTDIPTSTGRKDAKIVSKGRSSALLSAIPACKKIVTIRKVTRVLKIIASLTGAAYIGMCVFGVINLLPSAIIGCSYLAFTAISLLATFILLPKNK